MKTHLLLMVAAAGTLTFASCGNKSEKADDAAEAVEVSVEQVAVSTDPVVTAEQKQSLIDAKLVSDADFSHTIFIDFNATWCGPCRQFAPYFKAAADKYGDKATFIAVDTDQYNNVANAFGIQSIPTVIVLRADGTYITYVGTQDIVGDGVFDAIVENNL